MKGIWKKDFQRNNVEADFIVDDLGELPLIIKNLRHQITKSC